MMNELQKLPFLEEIWQRTLGWQPDDEQQQKLQKLYEIIVLGNKQFNLTRITEPGDFWEKHLWDSLAGVPHLERAIQKQQFLSIIDIGTGAGFPGIPLAIAFPDWTVTLLDSIHKKILFLNKLIAQLELKNIKTLVERAEKIGHNNLYREAYDMALIRAVAGAPTCAEYALPLLKIGGLAILYRGHWSDKESLALQPTVAQLGGKIELIQELITPLSQSLRNYIYLRKILTTPSQFPRTQIKKSKSVFYPK